MSAWVWVLLAISLIQTTGNARGEVSYRRDVMAILSKAGCNMGACHGNQNGKYGFKLSLRGESPGIDHNTITAEFQGRRINTWDPDKSLLLQKATTAIAHQGGKRFDRKSKYYQIIHDWIASGAPDDQEDWVKPVDIFPTPASSSFIYYPEKTIQIRVQAQFEDGTESEITDMAVYETSNTLVKVSDTGLVTSIQPGETTVIIRYLNIQKPLNLIFVPENPNFLATQWTSKNFIDQHIFQKLERLQQNASPVSHDTIFLRRVFMDLTGLPPSEQEIQEFLTHPAPDKRALWTEKLLETREFAEFWALKWADLLRVEEKQLDRKGVRAFYQWLQLGIANHKPIDELARDIISARGSSYGNPATNFFRANRSATQRGVATAQVFLGTRLQCAECHNHPFDKWTQNDYYSWASAFASIDYKILENNKRDGLDKHEFIGEQIIFDSSRTSINNPSTELPAPARALGAEQILPTGDMRRHALADWLTAPENRQFARVQVNRIWSHLMGRGLVHPVDDFRSTNPASHPSLLEDLTSLLINNDYQIRAVIKAIISSMAYQRSSTIIESNTLDDEVNYARVIPRRYTGEQILDAQCQALDVSVPFNGYAPGTRAAQIPGVEAIRARSKSPSSGDKFLKIFGKPMRLLTTDEERTCSSNMTQAFQMISSPLIHSLIADPNNILNPLASSSENDSRDAIKSLYLRFLSRPPSIEELEHLAGYVQSQNNLRNALEDISWALVNSKEFLFRF